MSSLYMYYFKRLENEQIIFISDNSELRIDEQLRNITSIVTNKRLLLLDYPCKYNNYEEALKTNGVKFIEKKEVFFEVRLDDIVYIENDKYTLKDTNYFYLKDKEIKRYIVKNKNST